MNIVENTQQLCSALEQLHGTIALVTTMGNLHKGHLSLIERAKKEADNVVVSIYINPLQFSANEDLSSYPRTLEEDISQLEVQDVDLLFTPTDKVIYPAGMESHTQVVVPGISDKYCGANRIGHFRGVTTIVCKLFNLISPDVAIFGNKDFQQLSIIRIMMADLAMPIQIIGVDTYREETGLAMSSRNRFLSADETINASSLYQSLQWAEKQLTAGNNNFTEIEIRAKRHLKDQGFDVEYFSICNRKTLDLAIPIDKNIVILTAAKFGRVRLIDNILIDLTTNTN